MKFNRSYMGKWSERRMLGSFYYWALKPNLLSGLQSPTPSLIPDIYLAMFSAMVWTCRFGLWDLLPQWGFCHVDILQDTLDAVSLECTIITKDPSGAIPVKCPFDAIPVQQTIVTKPKPSSGTIQRNEQLSQNLFSYRGALISLEWSVKGTTGLAGCSSRCSRNPSGGTAAPWLQRGRHWVAPSHPYKLLRHIFTLRSHYCSVEKEHSQRTNLNQSPMSLLWLTPEKTSGVRHSAYGQNSTHFSLPGSGCSWPLRQPLHGISSDLF